MYSLAANIELLGLCAAVVLILFCFNIKSWKPNIINPLSSMYILTIAGCFFEIAAFYADGKAHLIWLNYTANICYLSSVGLIGVCMLMFCNEQFPKSLWKNNFQFVLWTIPFFVELIMLISAPKTGLIFSVDSAGYYHRAATFVFQMIPYGYLLVTTGCGIYWFARSQTTFQRHKYLAIVLFAVPPILLGGIQLSIKANCLDILEFSFYLSLLANCMITQNNRITRDALTKLPNRVIFDSVLVEKMKNERRGDILTLFVLMCDIDNFKSINDTFGHLEGDNALCLVAESVQEVCKSYKATAARAGGDEFLIVAELLNEESVQHFISEINEAIEDAAIGKEYPLRMSIGYAAYRPSDTVTDLIKAADRELYKVKNSKRVGR